MNLQIIWIENGKNDMMMKLSCSAVFRISWVEDAAVCKMFADEFELAWPKLTDSLFPEEMMLTPWFGFFLLFMYLLRA